MSALWAGLTASPATEEAPASTARPKLRPVPPAPPRLARRPFAVVLIAVFGLGMTGLLLLNTTLQDQAFASRSLNRQATELAHVQADLQSQLDALAAPPALAKRASELGLRANPRPAFLVVPDGTVIGREYRVKGNEVEGLVVKTSQEMAADDAAAKARRAAQAARKAAEKRAAALRRQREAIEKAQAREEAAAGAVTTTRASDPVPSASPSSSPAASEGGNR